MRRPGSARSRRCRRRNRAPGSALSHRVAGRPSRRRPCSPTPAGAAPSTDRRSSWPPLRPFGRATGAPPRGTFLGGWERCHRTAGMPARGPRRRHPDTVVRCHDPEAPVPDRSFRLGYNTLTWADADPDLERVFATIKEAGWEGVELLNNDANWSGPPSRVRAMLERVGLPAIAMLGVVQIDEAREDPRHRDPETDDRLRCRARLRGVCLHRWRPDRSAAADRRRVQAPGRGRRRAHRACRAVRHDRQPPLASALHDRARDRAGPAHRARRPASPDLRRHRDLGVHGRGLHRADPALRPAHRLRPPQGLGVRQVLHPWRRDEGDRLGRGARYLHRDRLRRLGDGRALVVWRHARRRELPVNRAFLRSIGY